MVGFWFWGAHSYIIVGRIQSREFWRFWMIKQAFDGGGLGFQVWLDMNNECKENSIMLVLLLINFVRIIATIERQTRHWRWKLASIWWGVPRCTRPPHKSTCDHDGDLQSYRHGSPWKSSHRNYPCMYVWFGSVLQRKWYCKQMVKLQNWIHEKEANECVPRDCAWKGTHSPVPMNCTILTQQPLQSVVLGISFL